MKSPYLRVKIKSLTAESFIIKKEMTKFMGVTKTYRKLHEHRVNEVRKEARATLVAYGFLNGLPYSVIETACYEEPNWDKVKYMVSKYGEEGTSEERLERLETWKETTRDNRGMHRPVTRVLDIEPVS